MERAEPKRNSPAGITTRSGPYQPGANRSAKMRPGTRSPSEAADTDGAIAGALVTLAPAGVLAWHGAWIAAAVVLLAGAAKVATYEVGFLARGLTDRPPHATYIGAIGHAAIAYAVGASLGV